MARNKTSVFTRCKMAFEYSHDEKFTSPNNASSIAAANKDDNLNRIQSSHGGYSSKCRNQPMKNLKAPFKKQ